MRRWLTLGVGALMGQWLAFAGEPSPAALHRAGVAAIERHDYEQATRLWSRAVSLQPDNATFHYRLAASLEPASRNLRAAMPPGVKLLAAITPAPAGFVGPRYAETRRQMLRQWSQWLEADAALEDLPATLPDELFAKTTHLTEAGARVFTDALAHALEASLR